MNRGRQKGIKPGRRTWAKVTDLTLELRTGEKLEDTRVAGKIVPCSVCGWQMLPSSLGRHVSCDPCSTPSEDSPPKNP